MESVILVDEYDHEIGVMEKMQAHREAQLHRAFSIFLFNEQEEMLIHRRAMNKYHSGGLWTNACCSHQRLGESNIAAGKRRLQEEMGIACDLKEMFSFIYKAPLDNELTEHELDHVLFGSFSGTPSPNPEEVSDYKFVSLDELLNDVRINPKMYTEWFKIALPLVIKERNKITV